MTQIVDEVLAVLDVHAAEDPLEDAEKACLLLVQLLSGKPLEASLWTEEKRAELGYRWVPVMPRAVGPGDVVRVKQDAYAPDSKMAAHNGLVGTVVAIRRGVVMSYTGGNAWVTHPPAALERRVPVPHLASEGGGR